MTVDAVRAGYRLREYELDLEHRATGRRISPASSTGRAAAGLRSRLLVAKESGHGLADLRDAVRERRSASCSWCSSPALAFGATLANAELVERGDLFVKFQRRHRPDQRCRATRNAPISVQVDGTVRTLSGDRPPALRGISIAINRGGRIETKGLPVCHRSADRGGDDSAGAMAPAGTRWSATGAMRQASPSPNRARLPLQGEVLAFNTVIDGERAILAHVYGNQPFPNSRIFVFHIRRTTGTYGTLLTAALPASLNRNGYLKRISPHPAARLRLQRPQAQLPQRDLRGAGRLLGRRLPLRQGRDDLRRRP